MKINLTTLLVLLLFLKINAQENKELEIDPSKFDYQTVTQIINSDTITKNRCIERRSNIFRKGKDYEYQAVILNSNNDTLSKSIVKFIGTNTRSEYDSLSQMIVKMKFQRLTFDSLNLHYLSSNKTCCKWYNTVNEGIIENIERIWIHPIRHNQFILTETAGFPDVILPVELNKEWSNTTNIYGWGEWKGLILENNYKVISKKSYSMNIEEIECWEIKCITNFKDEINTHTFLYNENYGFVQMFYEFQNGIKIKFDMTKCILENEFKKN